MDRRRFLATFAAAAGAAAVVGFDPVTRRWVPAAEARGPRNPFAGVPPLDGELLTDLPTRAGDSFDMGNIVHILPGAVLRAGSIEDVAKMVRFCREHRVPVATRGQHHSLHGQGLTAGLIVESASFNAIHEITPTHATVGGGITYRELVEATLEQDLRPRALPGFLGLSICGNLSVGGVPMDSRVGSMGDIVRALQVVTGAGDIVECSETENRQLFDAMLGGLGQCGIITRVTIDLVPSLPMARTYWLSYVDARPFFDDFRTLFDHAEIDHNLTVCMPPGSQLFLYQIQATVFYDPASPPDDEHLLRDLTVPPALAVKQDRTYYDYVIDVDNLTALQEATLQWSKLVKPWYDMWLPDDAVEEHVGGIVAELTQEDVGAGGFVLLFMQTRSKVLRPFMRVPDARGADRVFLFDLATTSNLPGPDPEFAARMLARNQRWYEKARPLGGIRYPIGALQFGPRDWRRHFGDQWPAFERAKARFDPDNIMTPGLGIFSRARARARGSAEREGRGNDDDLPRGPQTLRPAKG